MPFFASLTSASASSAYADLRFLLSACEGTYVRKSNGTGTIAGAAKVVDKVSRELWDCAGEVGGVAGGREGRETRGIMPYSKLEGGYSDCGLSSNAMTAASNAMTAASNSSPRG